MVFSWSLFFYKISWLFFAWGLFIGPFILFRQRGRQLQRQAISHRRETSRYEYAGK